MKYIIKDSTAYEQLKGKEIDSGVYVATLDRNTGSAVLSQAKITSDEVINLDTNSYKSLVSEVELFFTDQTKLKFSEHGFVYKKSVLLYGPPGTGKTCLVTKLANEFLKNHSNGVILINPDLRILHEVFNFIFTSTPILVILEEFDDCTSNYESTLLNLLDGELQRENTFYLFTTNYIEKIPNRLLRPGRISNLVKIDILDEKARFNFLLTKLPTKDINILKNWAQKTDGFTIDKLKHTVLLVACLDFSINKAIEEVKNRENISGRSTELVTSPDNSDYNFGW